MRYHSTQGFGALRTAHADALGAYDKACKLNLNPADIEALSEAETEALDALIEAPASTPMEIAEKIRLMRDHGPLSPHNCCWDDLGDLLDQIDRDLIEQQRPCASPAMAEAFAIWAERRSEYIAACERCQTDAEVEPFDKRNSEAFLGLLALPCYTPGDFIVKAYCNLLDLASYANDPAGFIFEPAPVEDLLLGAGKHDDAAWKAVARDIDDSDLGACMIALGRIDFDAAAWLAAAERAGMQVGVTIQADGARNLYQGEFGNDRSMRCMRLLAGGLGHVGGDRRAALADYVEANRPDLVHDYRRQAEAAE